MFISKFNHNCVLLLAIGALVASVAANEQDKKDKDERKLKKAIALELEEGVTNEGVFKWLEEKLELDPQNNDIRLLVEARESVSTPRCTMEYQQLLNRMFRNYYRTHLESYLKEIRSQSRELCSQTYRQRFQAALAQIEPDKIEFVGKFAALLEETSRLHESLYDKLDISAVSLVPAIKKYTGDQLDSKNPTVLVKTRNLQRQQVSEALAPLLNTCTELIKKLEDFLWILIVIKRPSNIDSDMEQALWATKVCRSLRFENFESDILNSKSSHIEKEKLKSVEEFTRNFFLSIDSWLDHEVTKKGMEYRLNYHLSKEGLKRPELIREWEREFGDACKSYAKVMNNFLYIVDMELKSFDKESIFNLRIPRNNEILNQARVCEVFPSIS